MPKKHKRTHFKHVYFEHKQLYLHWQLAKTESAQRYYLWPIASKLALVFNFLTMQDDNRIPLELG
jgi:hypothetical protein